MSAEFQEKLGKAIQEECQQSAAMLAEDFPHLKSLLLKVAQMKKFDVLVSVEGDSPNDLKQAQRDFSLLEKAKLVRGETKYTHRNVYRQYELTEKGAELATKLSAETT